MFLSGHPPSVPRRSPSPHRRSLSPMRRRSAFGEKKAKQTAAVQEARTALLSKGRSPHHFLSNIVEVFMEGARTYALVDTGTAVSVIDGTLYRTLQKVTTSLNGLFLRKQIE